MCGKKMVAYVKSGWDYKEITVRCGSTSPTGEPYLCEKCTEVHAGRDWRREAEEEGETWEEDLW